MEKKSTKSSYLTNAKHLMTYFQILIRFVDKSELKKNKIKKELGRLLGGVANRPTVGPNKNLSRIFPPEWPESSTKSLQHCC
jgi:hypothetical protein